MNITKLKIWDSLQNLGFEPIKYYFNGKLVCTGASLRKKLISISGNEFYTDIITIEPHNYSNKKNYHITGKVNTPFTGKFYRYEQGRKVELFEQVNTINEFYKANDILKTVHLMLS